MYFYHGLKDGDFMQTLLSHTDDIRTIQSEKACKSSGLPMIYEPIMAGRGFLTVRQIMGYGNLRKQQVNSAMNTALIPLGLVEREEGSVFRYRWIDEV